MIMFQTHLSENKREVEWVKELEPDCNHYTEVAQQQKHSLSFDAIAGVQKKWPPGIEDYSCPLCPSYRGGGWGTSTKWFHAVFLCFCVSSKEQKRTEQIMEGFFPTQMVGRTGSGISHFFADFFEDFFSTFFNSKPISGVSKKTAKAWPRRRSSEFLLNFG